MGGARGTISRDLDLATGSDCVTSTSSRFSHGFGRSHDSSWLRSPHVTRLSLLFLDSFSLLVDPYHLMRVHLFRLFFPMAVFPERPLSRDAMEQGWALMTTPVPCVRMRHVSGVSLHTLTRHPVERLAHAGVNTGPWLISTRPRRSDSRCQSAEPSHLPHF